MNSSEILERSGGFERLLRLAAKTPAAGFRGSWSVVELQPDLFVPQWFTIGVAVQAPGERLHFKLQDEFKKFDRIYGNRFPPRMIHELVSHAEEALRAAAQGGVALSEVLFSTSALRLSAPVFTSGSDHEAIVERLFSEVAVMAAQTKGAASVFQSMDNAQVRALVNAELKRIAGLDYERMVVEGPNGAGMLFPDKGVSHWLDVSLRTKRACGSVVSAVYKSAVSVELNLLKSSRDLTTCSRLGKLDNVGLFLLLPDEQCMALKEFMQLGDWISEQEWKLERDGFRRASLPSVPALAAEIVEWAKPTMD